MLVAMAPPRRPQTASRVSVCNAKHPVRASKSRAEPCVSRNRLAAFRGCVEAMIDSATRLLNCLKGRSRISLKIHVIFQ